MEEVRITGRILDWGNSYGIRLKKADLERAGLKPGQEAAVRIEGNAAKIDLSHIRTYRSGRSDISERHDEYLGEAYWADYRKKQREWDAARRKKRGPRR